MIVIQEHFIAKPGQASKLAALMKEVAGMMPFGNTIRIMTNMTGEFNRVVMETELAGLADLDARVKYYETTTDPWKEKLKGYTDLWISGGREILRIV